MPNKTLATTLVLVAMTLTLQVGAQEAPKLVVAEKIIDLGDVPQGEVRDVEFKLTNEGEAELILKSVRPTCGCTVAQWPKKIEPGGKGVVAAKLDTAGFKGGIAKAIMVMSNDPKNSIVKLVIKADVKPYLEVLPSPIVRMSVLESEDAVEKVVIAGTSRSGDFKVTGAKAYTKDGEIDPAFKVDYRKLPETEVIDGRMDCQYEIAIRLTDEATVGPISSVVKVTTDSKKKSEVEVKVFGVVRPMLRVMPGTLQFGAVEARQQPSQNLVVENNRPDAKVAITGAKIDDPAFETSIVALEDGERYQITVTVSRDASPGIKDAVLVLKTTDAEFNELRVPVRASIR